MWKKGLYLQISLQDIHKYMVDIFIFITIIKGLDCLLNAYSLYNIYNKFNIIFRNALIYIYKLEIIIYNFNK